MKKILLIICLFLCSMSIEAKTINISGDGLLKQGKIKTSKGKSYNGSKTWKHNVWLKIDGKLVDIDNKPVINQRIYIKDDNTLIDTIYSDDNGLFEFDLNDNIKDSTSEKYFVNILLEFNTENQNELEKNLKIGKDISIINPYKISIQLDGEKEYFLQLNENNLESTSRDNNEDIIVLSTETFSAKYYRERNLAIQQATKMLQNVNPNFDTSEIEMLILDEKKSLKNNWKEIVKQEIIKEKKKKIEQDRIEKRKRKIIETPDNCNLTYKDEQEIFDAIEFVEYDLSVNIERAYKPLLYVKSGTWIAVPVQVFQILGNNQFLFKCGQDNNGPFLFCGKLKKCCRKENFYLWQWVDVVGVIDGTSSYITVFGEKKTIPKVNVYAIRPSIVMKNRFY